MLAIDGGRESPKSLSWRWRDWHGQLNGVKLRAEIVPQQLLSAAEFPMVEGVQMRRARKAEIVAAVRDEAWHLSLGDSGLGG